MPEKEARRRIFFALWPDGQTRRALVRATGSVVRRSGGRATPPDNLHVTLAFLGPVTEVLLERARRVPPLVSPHFELIFDRLGFWQGSRALWVSPRRVPRALVALEANLWGRLVEVGFERERRPYQPHITMARKARGVDDGVLPVSWLVSELALVESKPGGRHPVYDTLHVWPFNQVQ